MNLKGKNFKSILKKVCYGNCVIQMIAIPIALVSANLLSQIVNLATEGQVREVIVFSVVLMAVVGVSVLLQSVLQIIFQKEEAQAVHRCKMYFLEKLMENPLHKLFRTDSGGLMEHLTADITKVTKQYIEVYPGIAAGVLGVVGYLAFLVWKSPIAAVTLLGISLIQMIPPLVVKKYMQVSYEQCEEMEAAITDHSLEAVDGFETIKMYDWKNWWQEKMAAYHKKYVGIGQKADAAAAAQTSMYRLMDNLLTFGTYGLLGFYVLLQICSLDVAVQAIYLSGSFFGYVKSLFAMIPDIAVADRAKERLGKWIASDDVRKFEKRDSYIKNRVTSNRSVDFRSITDSERKKCEGVCNNSDNDSDGNSKNNSEKIMVQNVSYGYDDRKIMDGLHLEFDASTNYLIKGSNGAGKTTLLNLLAGLLLPEDGEILVNETLFYIPQQDPEYHFDVPVLFEMLGKEKQQKLYDLAETFGLTEKIKEGKKICDLSGGERKKLFLAMGFAMNTQWLLLDEPTNNLDAEGKKVLEQLLMERTGVIMVSHDMMFEQMSSGKMETIGMEKFE